MTLLTTYSIALLLGDKKAHKQFELDLDTLRQEAAMVTIHQQMQIVQEKRSRKYVAAGKHSSQLFNYRTKFCNETDMLNAVIRRCKEAITKERKSRSRNDGEIVNYLNRVKMACVVRNCLGLYMIKSFVDVSSKTQGGDPILKRNLNILSSSRISSTSSYDS
jgi:hypothetical protein